MIKKVVHKHDLHDFSSIKEDLIYWLGKTPEERVAAADYLRKQHHGSTERLQRSALKRALGRRKDLADLEALGEE